MQFNEMLKFDPTVPETPETTVTKFITGDEVGNSCHLCIILSQADTGFSLPKPASPVLCKYVRFEDPEKNDISTTSSPITHIQILGQFLTGLI